VPGLKRFEGATKLYFTGNDHFNRSMRLLASRKGMSLSQHGLFENVARYKVGLSDIVENFISLFVICGFQLLTLKILFGLRKRKTLTSGAKVAAATEEDIFQKLGLQYLYVTAIF
jgi:DNA polymerase/3'-5' exonuclease PolX